jgi:hypothetical protein
MDDIALVALFFDRHTVMLAFLDKSSYLSGLSCAKWQTKNDHLSNHCGIRNGFDQFLEISCFDYEATRSTVRHFSTPGDGERCAYHELARRIVTGPGNRHKSTLVLLGGLDSILLGFWPTWK